jgi:uncharacterized protein (DUF2336 family)
MTGSEILQCEQMSVPRSVMAELDAALQSGSVAKRTALLRRVTDLFLGGADNYSAEQVALFDDVMSRVITRIEARVLSELSARLAPIANAPVAVIQRLARDDDIVISGPVLQHSERLTDDDLVEIAKSKSQEHLFKISGRPRLSDGVTDVLVERGDAKVVNEVAANTGARFSKSGFSRLAIFAERDEQLTTTVASRADIPPLLLRHVLARATNAARERLLTSAQPQARDLIRKILTDVSRQMSGSLMPHQYADAQRLVDTISQDTELTKSKLWEFATAHQMAEMVVALSVLSAVPIDLVDHLVNSPSQFGVIVLGKAIGLDWRVAHAVMLGCRKPGESAPLETQDLHDEYQQFSVSLAQRLLRFWQARQDRAAISECRASHGQARSRHRPAVD